MKNQSSVTTIVQAAMIAAIYVVLTYLASILGLASYVVQVRFSEALTILPYFTPAAIPGLFIGCLLSNILTGCAVPDIISAALSPYLPLSSLISCADSNGWHPSPLSRPTQLLFPLCYSTLTAQAPCGCPSSP